MAAVPEIATIHNGWFPPAAPDDFRPGTIFMARGRIQAVESAGTRFLPDGTHLDAAGCTVLPGFVDIHIHGSAGHDTMDASAEALAAMARFLVRHGVTSFLPTTMTAGHDATLRAVRNVQCADTGVPDGARILGVHLEGPYVSPRFPGAQPIQHVRAPDLTEFAELVAAGPVCMITLAPEQPGGHDLVQAALDHGIVPVIGHSAATYEEAEVAMGLGVSQATHTYNAMTGLHHRQPGVLGAVLSNDNIYAQLIADNIHVHPAAMKILARCKGIERTILITDAIRATGLPAGQYDLGGQMVTVSGGECRLSGGTLAGSILTMEKALANFMQATGFSLAQAWPVTGRTAAAALGLDGDIGLIAPAYRADLAILDDKLEVVATLVGGKLAYLRDPERLHTQPS